MVNYKQKFDRFLSKLTSLKNKYNDLNVSKMDYRSIIAEKNKLILDHFHFDSGHPDIEVHEIIIASLLPEWATDYKKVSSYNFKRYSKDNLNDYKKFYKTHATFKRPNNLWNAKLEIRFEYFKYKINIQTNTTVSKKHKFLTYDETLGIYEKHQHQLEQAKIDLSKVSTRGGAAPAINPFPKILLTVDCYTDVA